MTTWNEWADTVNDNLTSLDKNARDANAHWQAQNQAMAGFINGVVDAVIEAVGQLYVNDAAAQAALTSKVQTLAAAAKQAATKPAQRARTALALLKAIVEAKPGPAIAPPEPPKWLH